MKEVKVQKRYQCDFCKYRSIRSRVEIHEKRCYRNPNRFCDSCENTGYVEEEVGDDLNGYSRKEKMPCYYCSKFDPKQLKEIEEREAKLKSNE